MLVAASAMLMSFGSMIAPRAEAGFNDFDPPLFASAPARSARNPAMRIGRAPRASQAQVGLATWYGPGFYGRRTASGERLTGSAMTAAHRSLPFGTRVEVVNEATGRSVVVRINDRGPYRRGAVIDLSRASAAAIGMSGTARVRLVSLGY